MKCKRLQTSPTSRLTQRGEASVVVLFRKTFSAVGKTARATAHTAAEPPQQP